eukprot:m.61490 g.61490  ORF g.61490 m.61490 type:complete len:128 (-) comp49460_c0_seq2:97-480(-)
MGDAHHFANEKEDDFYMVEPDDTILIGDSYTPQGERLTLCNDPRFVEYWRPVFVTLALILCGIGLLVGSLAAHLTSQPSEEVIAFLVMGIVCLIPGVYMFAYLIRAHLGHRGYNFDSLPQFECGCEK